MIPRRTALMVCLFACASSVMAAEGDQTFLERLRQRGYYDTASYFLDKQAEKTDLSPETKQAIPYERALIQFESAKSARDPKTKSAQMSQALGFLDQFVKDSPRHPLAGDANLRRAEILTAKADAELAPFKAGASGNAVNTARESARKSLEQASQILETAREQFETALKEFPSHVDAQKEPERAAARETVENNLVNVQINLARVRYQTAQTYPAGDAERKKLLESAAESFDKIHQQFRTTLAGTLARILQAKCYEELDELQKSLGLYQEILDHPDNSESMQRLKSQARYFQLICMNRMPRPDYQSVVTLGEQWLKDHRAESRSRDGLGIKLEVAKAYEGLGENKDLLPPEQKKFLRQAKLQLQDLVKFDEFSSQANDSLRRINTKLGDDGGKTPDTFDAALSLAELKMKEMQDLEKEIDEMTSSKKPAADIKRVQDNLLLLQKEGLKLFELTLSLAGRNEDPKKVNNARYLYSICSYIANRNYEASVLAEEVFRHAVVPVEGEGEEADEKRQQQEDVALNAAYISMMALVREYADARPPASEQGAALGVIGVAADRLIKRFPDNDKASEAEVQMGKLYASARMPEEASVWFAKVPESSPKYPDALLGAGQAFWNTYAQENRKPAGERPSSEELAKLKSGAAKKLQEGITKLTATSPAGSEPSPALIQAKFTLAQILVNEGQEAKAVELLTKPPHAPVEVIKVPDEKERPDVGVTSRPFASEVLKLMVRAYIGAGKTNEATATMKELEKVVSGQGGADVTQLYISVSKKLKDELDEYKSTGETERYNQLMKAFEQFMGELSTRTEGQTFTSLNWIGETYMALGDASTDDAGRAEAFYKKGSAAFQAIMTRIGEDQQFATPAQQIGTKIRLMRAMRKEKDFEGSEKLLMELLANRKNDGLLQTEAAELYLDWGTAGDSKYLETAISGNRKTGIWGFSQLAQRIQRTMAEGKADMLQQYLDARYKAALARLKLAQSQSSAEQYKTGEQEVRASVAIVSNLPDDQRDRFNDLYRQFLEGQGKEAQDLPRNTDLSSLMATPDEKPAEGGTAEATTKEASKETTDTPKTSAVPKKEAAESSGTMVALGALVALLAGCGIVWFMIYGQKGGKKKRPVVASSGKTATAAPSAGGGMPDFAAGFPKEASSNPSAAGMDNFLNAFQGTAAPATGKPAKPRPAKPAAATGEARPSASGDAPPKPRPRPAAPSAEGGEAAPRKASATGEGAPAPRPKPKPPTPPQ